MSARQSGGGAGRSRNKNSEMAKRLGPAPITWRQKAWLWPYHNNLGTTHFKPGDRKDTD